MVCDQGPRWAKPGGGGGIGMTCRSSLRRLLSCASAAMKHGGGKPPVSWTTSSLRRLS